MSKADVVALAYDLHIQCDGPSLVTTPGSDFSNLCSLLYEVATASPEESLAGAIIDFSRGRQRRDEDEYQQELERDEEAYASGDNFYHLRTNCINDQRMAAWYADASSHFPEDYPVHKALIRAAKAFESRAAKRELGFGPFIVWADQLPESRNESARRELEEMNERLREARILVGHLKRQARSLGYLS